MTDSLQDNPFFKMVKQIREQVTKDLYAGKLKYDSSIAMLQRNLKIAEEQDFKLLSGQINDTIGMIELERGNFKDAEKFYKKALKYFEEINDVGRIGIMLNNLGEVHRRSGDTQNASDYYIQARNLARQTSQHSLIITTYNNEGQAELANGNLEQAIELLKNGLVTHSDSGEWNLNTIKSTLPEIHSSLGEAYARQGDFKQAWTNVERSLEIAQEFQQVQQIARAYRTMALIALHENNDEHDILHYLQESERHWDLLNATFEITRVQVLKGDYYKSQGDDENAEKAYAGALEYFKNAQLNHEADKIRAKM